MNWSQAVSSQTSLLDTKVDEKFSKSAKEAIDLPSQDVTISATVIFDLKALLKPGIETI